MCALLSVFIQSDGVGLSTRGDVARALNMPTGPTGSSCRIAGADELRNALRLSVEPGADPDEVAAYLLAHAGGLAAGELNLAVQFGGAQHVLPVELGYPLEAVIEHVSLLSVDATEHVLIAA